MFFFNLENKEIVSKHIRELKKANSTIHKPIGILQEMHSFYQHSYTQNDKISINNSPSLLRLSENMHCLTKEDKLLLDADISMRELELIIKSSKSNRSPGPDGFSNESLKCFWPHISDILLQLMNSYRNKGEIEASQIMWLITCITKGGKLRKELGGTAEKLFARIVIGMDSKV